MANNVSAKLENGKLVLTCDISAGVVRRSGTKNGTVPQGTGDVLACVDFESLASLVNASGVTGEIKISLGVYLSDKARAKATQEPASKGKQAAKPVEEMTYEELRAFALQAKAREQGNVPAPTPVQASKPAVAPAAKKERSEAQKQNDARLAAAGKERLAAMRAGTLRPAK